MKCAAFILILVSLVYLSETILAPGRMIDPRSEQSCCMNMQTETASDCSMHSGCKDQDLMPNCPNQEKSRADKGHASNNGKCPVLPCDPANCPNCPLCYIATLTTSFIPAFTPILQIHPYPEYAPEEISDYHSRSWKPPNAAIA